MPAAHKDRAGAPARRVLMVNDIANTADGLCRALRSRGWTVDLVRFPQRADHPGTLALLWAQLRFALATAWRSRRYDLLHIHYGYFGLLGRISPRPYVLHCHGTDLRANLKGRLRRPTLAALRGAAHVFYATPDLAQYLPAGIAAKASFCPNIVDTEMFRPREEPAPEAEGVRIFISPKVDRYKGFEVLIPMIERLCECPEVAQISVFDFGNRRNLYRLPQHPKMKFLQRVSYDQMPSIIHAHDIVVGQMELGILSMSEKEAMACAKPLAVRFDFADVYPDEVPIMNAKTENELCDALIRLARSEKLRREFGAAGRDWIMRNHAFPVIAEALDQRLATVIGRAGPPPRRA